MGACCDGYALCISYTFSATYKCIVYVKDKTKQCCACWWYPLKECCVGCCDSCDKYLNPHKDEAYTNI